MHHRLGQTLLTSMAICGVPKQQQTASGITDAPHFHEQLVGSAGCRRAKNERRSIAVMLRRWPSPHGASATRSPIFGSAATPDESNSGEAKPA
jgi:hypothetical protein